jgi:rod shape-determining protein MreC
MDLDLYERYRATLVLVGVAFLCFILLYFQNTSGVRHLRTWLVRCTLPTGRFLSEMQSPSTAVPETVMVLPDGTTAAATAPGPAAPAWSEAPELSRKLQLLEDENHRLRELIDLRQRRWPRAVAAHVSGRDPQRWFQEIVLDKGKDDGVEVDRPVLAVVDGREGLVGRVTEVGAHVAKVMLVQDSLSAVAATVSADKPADGIVEGTNGHELMLKYLDRSRQLHIGDMVLTSGLGKTFPEGVLVGWVEDIGLDPRQLFLQAKLRPAVRANQLRVVLILVDSESEHEAP